MSAAKDGGTRRTWSLEERQRIVAEALAPGASVAAVARRHGGERRRAAGAKRSDHERRFVTEAEEEAVRSRSSARSTPARDDRPRRALRRSHPA